MKRCSVNRAGMGGGEGFRNLFPSHDLFPATNRKPIVKEDGGRIFFPNLGFMNSVEDEYSANFNS